ncbi:MAG: hypothetical protein DCF19_19800, partial [Pseudanabaena frigida]
MSEQPTLLQKLSSLSSASGLESPKATIQRKWGLIKQRYQAGDALSGDSITESSQQLSTNPIQRKINSHFAAIRDRRNSGSPIQAQLSIGEPNDKYEKEADETAAKVVQQINTPIQSKSIQRQQTLSVKRKLQAKSLVQKRENVGGGDASADLESAINSARGGGNSLDDSLQKSMGKAMGADFSGVKVHTNPQADMLNRSVGALAFTTGQDLFFKSGQYNPSSKSGQELIAHELTHVVQQNGNAVQRHQDEDEVQMKPDLQLHQDEDEVQMKPDLQLHQDEDEVQMKPDLQLHQDEDEVQMKPDLQLHQ